MYPNLIRHIQKFVSLSDADIDTVLQYVKPLDVKKKAYLLKEGQACKAMYFVETGCLRMFFYDR